ncbi:hypothetical protein AgCh_031354 [Apium graveolens]
MPGHSLERCFRIHGFPPNFKTIKDKKVAAMVLNQPDSHNDSDVKDHNANQLSTEQYHHLMQLQGKQSIFESREDSVTGHALLADTYFELAAADLLKSGSGVRFTQTNTLFHRACQNAVTSSDETVYELFVPVDKPEVLPQAISIQAEFSSEYAERLPIGLEKVIRTVSPRTVKQFYRKWYHLKNMVIVAIGDFADTQV